MVHLYNRILCSYKMIFVMNFNKLGNSLYQNMLETKMSLKLEAIYIETILKILFLKGEIQ